MFFGNAKEEEGRNLDTKKAANVLSFNEYQSKKLRYVIPAKFVINPQLYNIHFVLFNQLRAGFGLDPNAAIGDRSYLVPSCPTKFLNFHDVNTDFQDTLQLQYYEQETQG